MDFRSRPRGRKLAALAALAVVLAAVAVTVVIVVRQPVPVTARTLRIAVTDGPGHDQHVSLDATFFTPPGHGRVPAILLAHGFGETKDAVRPEAEQLARAGFAVLTWSARGFGRSTGQVALDAPDYEVTDVEQLVSWLARQPRVRLDGPGDPRVGITGASYGGALALLAAAYDHRIDAVVPQTTWYNLATALFPNAASGPGVPRGRPAGCSRSSGPGCSSPRARPGSGRRRRRAAGSGPGRLYPPHRSLKHSAAGSCPRSVPCTSRWPRPGGPPPVYLPARASSPSSVASRIDVPTLLIQCEIDSLFRLDQPTPTTRPSAATARRSSPSVSLSSTTSLSLDPPVVPAHPALFLSLSLSSQTCPRRAANGGPEAASPPRPLFGPVSRPSPSPAICASTLPPFSAARFATSPLYPFLSFSRLSSFLFLFPSQTFLFPPFFSPPSLSLLPFLFSSAGLPHARPERRLHLGPSLRAAAATGSVTVRVSLSGAADITVFAAVYDIDHP